MKEQRELSGGAEKVEEIAAGAPAAGPDKADGAALEKAPAAKRAKKSAGGAKARTKKSAPRAQAAEDRRAMQGEAAAGGRSAAAEKKAAAKAEAAKQREQARAEKRVALAEKKQAEKEQKQRLREERAALKKQRAEEKRRAALEKKADRRAHAKKRRAAAEERAAHSRAARAQRKTERGGEKKHARAPGFGGWLAATISLSVAVLALGAIVTVGYFDLSGAKSELAAGYQASAYEFSEAVEELDANLVKARIAEGGELSRLLSEIYADSLVAENCVEPFPGDGRETAALSGCINRTGAFAKEALRKLTGGGTLTAADREKLAALYEEIELVRGAMPALIEQANAGTADSLSADGGAYASEFEKIARRLAELHPEEQPAAAREALAGEKELSEEEAAELLKTYLADYDLREVRAVGKEEGRLPCYAFEAADGSGRQYYAQLTVRGGKLAMLESYVPCTQNNYDPQTCVQIAEKFLETCGYEGLEAVWTSEAGTECTVEFVPVQEGALLYPDLLKVKVCRERGAVTGVAAGNYLLNHRARSLGGAEVPASRVRANAEKKLENVSVRAAVIPQAGGELLCWQVRGESEGTLYFAYIDAQTGQTAEIRAVRKTDRGDLPL